MIDTTYDFSKIGPLTNRLNVDSILITSPRRLEATCQPIIATAGTRSVWIGCRLPVADALQIFKLWTEVTVLFT